MCQSCGNNVKVCDQISGQIKECQKYYAITIDSDRCIPCNTDGGEVRCDECYLDVSNNPICLKCSDGYVLDPKKNCLKCNITMPHCAICQAGDFCVKCDTNYTNQNNASCSQIENCYMHNNYHYGCDICHVGYYYNKGTKLCEPCSSSPASCAGKACPALL